MNGHYRVVVIGSGIVGCSVAYHLTLRGLTDVALIERAELTAGSSWHAAGGFHAINGDTDVAALQKYTIGLYPQVEAESGQSVGLKMTGGLELAGTPERWRRWSRSSIPRACRAPSSIRTRETSIRTGRRTPTRPLPGSVARR